MIKCGAVFVTAVFSSSFKHFAFCFANVADIAAWTGELVNFQEGFFVLSASEEGVLGDFVVLYNNQLSWCWCICEACEYKTPSTAYLRVRVTGIRNQIIEFENSPFFIQIKIKLKLTNNVKTLNRFESFRFFN